MSYGVEGAAPFRVGHWLPSDQTFLETWLEALVDEDAAATAAAEPKPKAEQGPTPVDSAPPVRDLAPVLKEFRKSIEADPEIYMGFSLMFSQVRSKWSPVKTRQVKDYVQMLHLMDIILKKAPPYSKLGDIVGLVGFPINAILDWSMGTTAGFWAFTNEKVNRHLEDVLDAWGEFLCSPKSQTVLTDSRLSPEGKKLEEWGWFSPLALQALADADPLYRQGDNPKESFIRNFVCDPSQEHWGFASWDAFFTRQFRPGVRPVASPEDEDLIVNACESGPYRIASSVQKRDSFWIKAQPYSLAHMLDNDECVEEFVDGTVYQAFLSAKSYHRWHSPVDGTIVKVTKVRGTYYSETPAEGYDPAAPNNSQGYITEVATRALIFIQADNAHIGLMCVVAVGMAEVSSCDVTVYKGQHVNKGDQLGMFHFGGSTHCLVFRRGVRLSFDLHGQKPGLESSNIPVNSRIATVWY